MNSDSFYHFSVLIAEDDAVAREMLGIMITRKFPGINVYCAENGRTGLELFRRHKPEIVITDINMPDMDGIDMAKEIKSIRGDTKFIVITAYSDNNYFDKFSEIGFDHYMSKPIEFSKLFAAIKQCIHEEKL